MKKILNHCLLIFMFFAISCEKKNDEELNKQNSLPEVNSKGFSSITLNSVFCKGEVLTEGESPVIYRGFCWNNLMNPTVNDRIIFQGSGPGVFDAVISGLSPNTTYYVRVFAINSTDTVYSSGMLIKTYTRLISDIDGNEYYTVKIGSQEWMAENLKVTHFRNGDLITNVSNESIWDTIKNAAICNYNNEITIGKVHGYLYNGWAVTDIRQIAPNGWHIPTDEEWSKLIAYLGGGDIAGRKMIEIGSEHWVGCGQTSPTNESGFTAFGSGIRLRNVSSFYGFGSVCYWWSSSESGTDYLWFRQLTCGIDNVTRLDDYKGKGFSIRCIKD